MYSYIQGYLVEKKPAYVILDCNGIGYHINISMHTYSKLPEPGHEEAHKCKLLTHLIVREDATILFGFTDETERELFRELISVSGIGANTARLILSSLSPQEINTAINQGNVPALQSIKGIGAKTAQRIIIDLRGKMSKSPTTGDILGTPYNTNKEEALSGLVMLGFNKNLADRTLQKILSSEGSAMTVEDLIKNALKML